MSPITGNTVITVRIKEAEIEHRVSARDFEAWLERSNQSSGEMIRRQWVRDRLKPEGLGENRRPEEPKLTDDRKRAGL